MTTTQTQHPARTMVRTAFEVIVGVLLLLPVLVEADVLDVDKLPWLALPLAVSLAVTKALSLPAVERFLRRYKALSWLAAEPKSYRLDGDERGAISVNAVLIIASLGVIVLAILVLLGVV